jgi:hypothetical protein
VLAAAAVVSAGCAQSGASAPANRAALVTVAGSVLGAPGCPGPVRLDSPCPPRPLGGTRVEAQRGAVVVASATTGSDGHFSLKLPPGAYRLVATAAGTLHPTTSTRVTAVASPLNVTLTVDTGMR